MITFCFPYSVVYSPTKLCIHSESEGVPVLILVPPNRTFPFVVPELVQPPYQIKSASFLSSFDGNYLGLQPITLWPDTPSRNDKVSL